MNYIKIKYEKNLNMINKTKNFIKIFKKFYKNLNDKEKKVLTYYKSIYYTYINKILYHGNLGSEITYIHDPNNCDFIFSQLRSHIQKYIVDRSIDCINTLDQILYKCPLTTQNITVFKGLSKDITKKIQKLKINDTFKFDTFLSTSFSPIKALSFANKNCCVIIINIPKKINYLYLPWGTGHKNLENELFSSDEFELLFPRGMILQLTKITEEYSKIGNKGNTYRNLKRKKGTKMKFFHFDVADIQPKILDLDSNKIMSMLHYVKLSL